MAADERLRSRVFIGVGANLGGPDRQVESALAQLETLHDSRLLVRSSLYRSAPQGPQDQPDFCNAVGLLETCLNPERLLDELQALEARAGRQRTEHWGPRILDLDILSYGDIQLESPRLTLPHPWLHRRAFVLVPLLEIAPESVLPRLGAVRDYLEALDCSGLSLWRKRSDVEIERMISPGSEIHEP